MGLDAVELVIAVEERFAIAIDDAEAAEVRTVGQLEKLIAKKLVRRNSEACLTSFVFYRLRSALRQLFGVARAQVTPKASLGSLLPKERRRDAWAILACALGWRLPELRRNRTLQSAMLLVFLVPIPVAIVAGALGLVSKTVVWAVGLAALPGLWLAYIVTVPLAVNLPAQCATVRQAAEAMLALNFGRIARDRQSWSDEELWNMLRKTIVEQLGVNPAKVTRDARFIEDLGLD